MRHRVGGVTLTRQVVAANTTLQSCGGNDSHECRQTDNLIIVFTTAE